MSATGGRQAREAVVERDRAQLADLDRQRERHLAEYDRLVDEGSSLARIALERVERLDQDRESRQQALEQAEAVLSEWAGPPDVDAALDYYTALSDLVEGRVKQAKGAADLNRTLGQMLAGLWAGLDGDTLHVQFHLRVTDEPDTLNNGLRQVLARSLGERRITLPKSFDPPKPFDPESISCTPELDALVWGESDDPVGLLHDLLAEQKRSGKPYGSPWFGVR